MCDECFFWQDTFDDKENKPLTYSYLHRRSARIRDSFSIGSRTSPYTSFLAFFRTIKLFIVDEDKGWLTEFTPNHFPMVLASVGSPPLGAFLVSFSPCVLVMSCIPAISIL